VREYQTGASVSRLSGALALSVRHLTSGREFLDPDPAVRFNASMPKTATPIPVHAARAADALTILSDPASRIADRLAAAKALESAACQIRRATVKDADAQAAAIGS